MSEKCRKRPLSKNEDTKAVHHFEENNYDGDDLHANSNKIGLSVQRLRAFKISPSLHSSFFTSYQIPMFLISGLKFMLKLKLYTTFNLMQKIL